MPAKRTVTASETVTVRLTPGTANKIRAITGQDFSTFVRMMCTAYLSNHVAEVNAEFSQKNSLASELGDLAASTSLEKLL